MAAHRFELVVRNWGVGALALSACINERVEKIYIHVEKRKVMSSGGATTKFLGGPN
jgi:hypothetical protein